MKNVIIFGAAGFIGYWLSKKISKEEVSLTLVDKCHKSELDLEFLQLISLSNVKYYSHDLSVPISFESFNETYDEVYMLASIVGVNYCIENPCLVLDTNTKIIINSTEWLKKAKVKKVIFTSSSECYAGTTEILKNTIPTDESIPLTIEKYT